jgi:acyl-CoA thioester hydrolase
LIFQYIALTFLPFQTTIMPIHDPYELEIPVLDDDIDILDHVSNIVYLRWVQDAAIAHWSSLASSEDQQAMTWVILRHEIDYKRSAVRGDIIIAKTWVGNASRLSWERHTEILRASDRKLLAKALTLWCPVDMKTKKPLEPPERVRALFCIEYSGK